MGGEQLQVSAIPVGTARNPHLFWNQQQTNELDARAKTLEQRTTSLGDNLQAIEDRLRQQEATIHKYIKEKEENSGRYSCTVM